MSKGTDVFALIANVLPTAGELSSGKKVGKRVINRLIRLIDEEITDPRQEGKVVYPLHEIIVLTFFGVLAGADNFSAVAACAHYKEQFFRTFLPLKQGIPTHDTFNRVFSLIDLAEMERAVVTFVSDSFNDLRKLLKVPEPEMKQLCVDGKVSRGSGRNPETEQEIRDIQTLHVYSVADGICLSSRQIDGKSNEIPAAQKILATMDLKNTLVTFDAMHTQTETVAIIVAHKGYYLGGLKGNQQTMLEESAYLFTEGYLQQAQSDARLHCRYTEKAHNQIEIMDFTLARIPAAGVAGSVFSPWAGIKSVLRYDRQTEHLVNGKKTREIRYYISNCSGNVSELAAAVRAHWQVESFHWLLDVMFSDDANSTVNRRASGNMLLLKKMALSLYRLMKPMEKAKHLSDVKRLFEYAYEEGIYRLLAHCDAVSIQKALEQAQGTS